MIKSIIIDDERNSVDVLDKLVNRFFKNQVQVVTNFNNLDDAVQYLHLNDVDLVFLDIKLEFSSGLDLLYQFKDKKNFEVICVTAYKEYAIEALRCSAFDYLLKPINYVELISAIKRLQAQNKPLNLSLNDNPEYDVSPNKNAKKRDSIAFPSKNGFKVEKLSSIVYCEAKGNYAEVHLYPKSQILISKTLKKLVDMIDHPDFFRIHKSYYINMNYIVSYNRSENIVELKNGKFLPVSVRKNESFVKKLVSRN